MENFVGAPTGIEPASPAFRAGVLTTTPQHPGTKCIKFASSNHPWQMVLQHDVITTVFTHCESAREDQIEACREMIPSPADDCRKVILREFYQEI